MEDNRGTVVIDIAGLEVEVFYADTRRGIELDCVAYVHPFKYPGEAEAEEGREFELEDLMPCWHARQDLKDRIHRDLHEEQPY